ncbi:hypothetical protein P22_1367 [Propionispora sp. 2/2-37]|nr:hypothetical protein P22_1367 [Propionispora sp. 2/2-37]
MAESVKDIIKQLIMSESIYHPLTDEEIAQTVSVLRETVTGIRKELNIPSSRERRKKNIQDAIEVIKNDQPNIAISHLVNILTSQGFEVTRNYIADIVNKNPAGQNQTGVMQTAPAAETVDFSALVGHNCSLVKNIQQAKAAVLYPPYGLPTLIVGDSGTGKSKFAECMYQYAKNKKILAEKAPFIALNCADYGDNPQLILSILYGHRKGSFTGADQDAEGLVERANGGILFLDEIHRLPPKGQEMLFSLLDKGKFRRLGETDTEREARVYFIGATTENIESSLLLTFRRRIPMIIELPRLEDRSLQEKAQLIYDFFQNEANRTKCTIAVKSRILSAFAMKEYDGNIGQLKSEIQVTCANAYVEKMNSGKNEINIGFNELLYNTLFHDKQNSGKRRNSAIVFQDTLFVPHITTTKIQHEYPIFEDIYKKVEKKYYELKEMDISSSEIEKIIWTFVLNKFKLIGSELAENKNLDNIDEFKYLVGETISEIIKDFFVVISNLYPDVKINKKVLIYLAIHLSEAIKRIKYNQDIINPNLLNIKRNFENEYTIALQLAREVEKAENIDIPEGEIGFIAMYVKELLQVTNKKNKVAIITVCHGKIASEMIAIVHQLMGVDFPIAVDMPFNTNPTKVFEQVIEIAKTFESDMGILFFVDMGSLVNIGEVVQKRTGIKTRTIDRVDLVSVMEAVRKAYISDQNSQETLDDIYYEIINSRHSYPVIPVENSNKPPMIICMCLTGHGVAVHINDILSEYYPNVKRELLSLLDEELKLKIDKIRQQYNLIAIVGTINPQIEGINFIPFEFELNKNKKMLLDYLIKQQHGNTLKNILREDLILLRENFQTKQEVIEALGSVLFNHGYVKKQFLQSLTAREEMSSTCFKNGIAIPHGLPSLVNESAVVFIKLNQYIEWDNHKNKVNLICLPAVKNDDISIITDLFYSLKREEVVKQLLKARNESEFIQVLCLNSKNNMV